MKKVIIAVVVLLVAAIGVGSAYVYKTITDVANAETICEGVSIDGVDVSGMSKKEAKDAVTKHEDELKGKTVTLTYKDKDKEVALEKLGYEYSDVDKAVKEAYDIGKAGSVLDRYKAIKAGAGKGTEIEISKSLDEEAFDKYIKKNEDTFIKVAKDATIKRKNGEWIITDEVEGQDVPIEENMKELNKMVNDNWDGQDFEYELVVETATPEYTREDMEKLTSVLGTYTTSYASSGYNRKVNVKNAAEIVDGTVLYPGEEYSVLEHLLPFTAEHGYLLAGSYAGGEVVETYGGGVCQVATTLYNAVIRAELEVVERYCHGMVVSYVPHSFDAAISESGNKTLRFKNNLERPIFIEGKADGSSLTFTIYGEETRPSNRTIEFYSKTTATIQPGKDIVTKDKTMKKGKEEVTQPAHTGYRAELWKKVIVDGKEESNEKFNDSYYGASPRRVTVGTMKDKKDKKEKKDSKPTKKEDTKPQKEDTTPSTEAPAEDPAAEE